MSTIRRCSQRPADRSGKNAEKCLPHSDEEMTLFHPSSTPENIKTHIDRICDLSILRELYIAISSHQDGTPKKESIGSPCICADIQLESVANMSSEDRASLLAHIVKRQREVCKQSQDIENAFCKMLQKLSTEIESGAMQAYLDSQKDGGCPIIQELAQLRGNGKLFIAYQVNSSDYAGVLIHKLHRLRELPMIVKTNHWGIIFDGGQIRELKQVSSCHGQLFFQINAMMHKKAIALSTGIIEQNENCAVTRLLHFPSLPNSTIPIVVIAQDGTIIGSIDDCTMSDDLQSVLIPKIKSLVTAYNKSWQEALANTTSKLICVRNEGKWVLSESRIEVENILVDLIQIDPNNENMGTLNLRVRQQDSQYQLHDKQILDTMFVLMNKDHGVKVALYNLLSDPSALLTKLNSIRGQFSKVSSGSHDQQVKITCDAEHLNYLLDLASINHVLKHMGSGEGLSQLEGDALEKVHYVLRRQLPYLLSNTAWRLEHVRALIEYCAQLKEDHKKDVAVPELLTAGILQQFASNGRYVMMNSAEERKILTNLSQQAGGKFIGTQEVPKLATDITITQEMITVIEGIFFSEACVIK